MKRALSTFGNPFGLALYDKEQQNVRGRRKKQPRSASNGKDRSITWLVLSSEGEYMSAHEDPVDYCKAMRQLLEAISTRDRLRAFWQRNLVTIAMLRRNLPALKTEKGEHYADILTSLYKQQMRLVWEEAKATRRRASKLARQNEAREGLDEGLLGAQEAGQLSSAPEKDSEGRDDRGALETKHAQPSERQGPSESQLEQWGHSNGGTAEPSAAESRINGGAAVTGRVEKINLAISTPRRIRDKEHLRYVASQPCIICGRAPGHAHHLRFAQPRALGRKVSDEWTVSLCSTHHSALHSVGDEKQWWRGKGIDPIAHAERLWRGTRHGGVGHPDRFGNLPVSSHRMRVIDGTGRIWRNSSVNIRRQKPCGVLPSIGLRSSKVKSSICVSIVSSLSIQKYLARYYNLIHSLASISL
jgi:hypothetical protein